MNTTLATFFKMGITALAIGVLLFTVGYGLVKAESDSYQEKIESVKNQLPTLP